MNASRICAELDAIIARAQALKEHLASDGDGAPRITHMTQADYAVRVGRSVGTIRKWVKAGLPVVRRGRLIMVDIEKADRWELKDEDARAAEHATHRGDG